MHSLSAARPSPVVMLLFLCRLRSRVGEGRTRLRCADVTYHSVSLSLSLCLCEMCFHTSGGGGGGGGWLSLFNRQKVNYSLSEGILFHADSSTRAVCFGSSSSLVCVCLSTVLLWNVFALSRRMVLVPLDKTELRQWN